MFFKSKASEDGALVEYNKRMKLIIQNNYEHFINYNFNEYIYNENKRIYEFILANCIFFSENDKEEEKIKNNKFIFEKNEIYQNGKIINFKVDKIFVFIIVIGKFSIFEMKLKKNYDCKKINFELYDDLHLLFNENYTNFYDDFLKYFDKCFNFLNCEKLEVKNKKTFYIDVNKKIECMSNNDLTYNEAINDFLSYENGLSEKYNHIYFFAILYINTNFFLHSNSILKLKLKNNYSIENDCLNCINKFLLKQSDELTDTYEQYFLSIIKEIDQNKLDNILSNVNFAKIIDIQIYDEFQFTLLKDAIEKRLSDLNKRFEKICEFSYKISLNSKINAKNIKTLYMVFIYLIEFNALLDIMKEKFNFYKLNNACKKKKFIPNNRIEWLFVYLRNHENFKLEEKEVQKFDKKEIDDIKIKENEIKKNIKKMKKNERILIKKKEELIRKEKLDLEKQKSKILYEDSIVAFDKYKKEDEVICVHKLKKNSNINANCSLYDDEKQVENHSYYEKKQNQLKEKELLKAKKKKERKQKKNRKEK